MKLKMTDMGEDIDSDELEGRSGIAILIKDLF